MFRILRAFAWLRWRILLNSLERHGARDTLERFSLAIDQLTPIIVALVMVPSVVVLAGAGAYAGWSLAQPGGPTLIMEIVRFALLGGCVFALVGPIMLPTGDRTNAVRLLLLPIPRAVLYLAQLMSMLADPWMLLMVAVLIAFPCGLAAGGAPAAAGIGTVAGLLLIAALAGIGVLVTTAVHLAVRDRRRGEILTLIFIMGLPLLGILPGVIGSDARDPATAVAHQARDAPEWWSTFERRALAVVPSEMYVASVKSAARSDYLAGSAPLLTLAAAALILHGLAFAGFARLLNTPAAVGPVRSQTTGRLGGWHIPGVSAGTSAVAMNQLKLAFRTPRGRSTLLSPLVMFGVFAALTYRSAARGSFAFIPLEGGPGLAAFTSFFALLCLLPLAMNQFAIDRAGLTLAFLVPLETRALLVGKAIGNGLIVAMPAAVCIAGSFVLFPDGGAAVWLAVPLTMLAAYILVAPVAAALSAAFPRTVDLNSIGQGSNAHGAAGLLGALACVAAAAPGFLLTVLAINALDRPALAPVFLLVWILCSAGISTLLFSTVARFFEQRRENLAMVA